MHKAIRVALTVSALSIGAVAFASPVRKEPLDAAALSAIKSKFGRLMKLASKHDFKSLHGMFWQSPSTLLVAKSAIQSEGNWAGFWGNEAIDQKLHDIGSSGPAVLEPDYSKLKVVGLTRDVAESYVPKFLRMWAEAMEQIQKCGTMVKSPTGFPIQSPYLSIANRQAEIMMRIASEFGFTPASRSRISAPPPDQLPLFDGVPDQEG